MYAVCLLVQFETDRHQASFVIKIRHGTTPKLYNTGSKQGKKQDNGTHFKIAHLFLIHKCKRVSKSLLFLSSEYNVSALVTIATKTFLRYDKLQDLIDSVRRYYPTVTIVIADDSQNPKTISGPYIEHYIMPFGKVSRDKKNLTVGSVSQRVTLYYRVFSGLVRRQKPGCVTGHN